MLNNEYKTLTKMPKMGKHVHSMIDNDMLNKVYVRLLNIRSKISNISQQVS